MYFLSMYTILYKKYINAIKEKKQFYCISRYDAFTSNGKHILILLFLIARRRGSTIELPTYNISDLEIQPQRLQGNSYTLPVGKYNPQKFNRFR